MITSYSPDKVLFAIDSVPITGFISGDFITIEHSGDDAKATQGSHGSVAVAQLNNNLSTLKFTLLHGVSSHAAVMSMQAVSKATSVLAHTVIIKDMLGTLLVTGKAWFTKPAPIKFGEGGGDHEWSMEGVFQIQDNGGVGI